MAFVLIGSFAFANSYEVLENSNTSDFVTANFDNLVAGDYGFRFNENQLSRSEFLALKDCTLRGKFTIIFSDGSSYSWEGTLTIVGQSCAEFLKELMAE